MKKISVIILSLLLCIAVTMGYKNSIDKRMEDESSGTLKVEVDIRFDKQNDVFYQLGGLLEDYINSNRREADATRVNGFCKGINCFARNDISSGYFNCFLEENQALRNITWDLMGLTAEYELDKLDLSALSDRELEQLITLCRELGTCCDRAEEGTLAYHVSNRLLEGDSYENALRVTQNLLEEFDEIIRSKVK